jgi:hypothetical protein
MTSGTRAGLLGRRKEIKDDGCERGEYRGENLNDDARIFYFEEGFGVSRVWMV